MATKKVVKKAAKKAKAPKFVVVNEEYLVALIDCVSALEDLFAFGIDEKWFKDSKKAREALAKVDDGNRPLRDVVDKEIRARAAAEPAGKAAKKS